MQPAYYENLIEIQNKYWSMLDDAVTNRSSPFRIPVFMCANQNEIDGRIVVLRKSNRKNNLLPASYEVIYGHTWNIPKPNTD